VAGPAEPANCEELPMKNLLVPIFVCFAMQPSMAVGWTRLLHEDAKLVKRSELIIIGRLKPGTLVYIPNPEGRQGWEHRATVTVKEVLKGECKDKEIPIIIHYGLAPVVGGNIKLEGRLEIRRGGKDVPKDIIQIYDTGNSAVDFSPVIKDAREDNIWFLRKSNGPFEQGTVATDFGIVEPEDVQPIVLKDYYSAHLSAQPQKAMKALLTGPQTTARPAQCFLDLQDLRHDATLPDVKVRAEKLAVHYQKASDYSTWLGPGSSQGMWIHWESRKGIASCGPAAGPPLVKLFGKEPVAHRRWDIIRLWGEIGYTEAVPILTDLLLKHDRFWSEQNLPKGWWHDDSDPKAWGLRHDMAYETHRALETLVAVGDRRGREAIQATLKRWQSFEIPSPEKGGPPSIVAEAERALKKALSAEP
jgi:hypothetical protein